MKRRRAVLYARLFTDNREADPEIQLRPLRERPRRDGFEIVREFINWGPKLSNYWPEFDILREFVRKEQVGIALVENYSRFARSIDDLKTAVLSIHESGADFISLENEIDTSKSGGYDGSGCLDSFRGRIS